MLTLSLLPNRSLRTQSCPISFQSLTAPMPHSCASPALWRHRKSCLFMVLGNDIELWEENRCWIKFLERWLLVLGSEYIIFHGLSGMVESTRKIDWLDAQTCSLPGPPRSPPPTAAFRILTLGTAKITLTVRKVWYFDLYCFFTSSQSRIWCIV